MQFVVECFWPDVKDVDVETLDRRVVPVARELSVRYLGSILLRDDEVVLCRFEGSAATVEEVAVRAEIPFERILRSKEVHS
jgi:hypothetical protein